MSDNWDPDSHPAPAASRIRKMASRSIAPVRNLLLQRAYPAFCEGLAVVGRPLLLSRAEDMTAQTATRSCLVLAPHPDDETLGCGATIMRKLAAGTSVQIVIATDGRYWPPKTKLSADALAEMREEEAHRAGAILGLPCEHIAFLRFEDGRLADHPVLVFDFLLDIFENLAREEFCVPSIIDPHPDHRVL